LLDRYCEEIGRDPASLRRSLEVPIAVATDAHTLQRRMARVIQARHYPPDRASDMFISGTPDQCTDRIQRYIEMGFSEFMLITLEPFDDEELECFAAEVLPAFHARDRARGSQADG
jgi:alkanesulfonate monooxygenase SsuD/methylene tetrahydromethanopterin reductase-like flavin-dependent oxidoreductase (luciferase family)